MGLDTVELVIEIEETFGISIDDSEGQQIQTVGELYDLVIEKRGKARTEARAKQGRVCLTAATFYRIRRALIDSLGLERSGIHPGTCVHKLIPFRDRREAWSRLQASFKFRLPPLVRPSWLIIGLALIALGVSTSVAVISELLLFGLLVGTALSYVAFRITQPLAVFPHRSFVSVGRLSELIVVQNYQRLEEIHNGWNPSDVWTTMRILLVQQLGVDPKKVTSDALIIDLIG